MIAKSEITTYFWILAYLKRWPSFDSRVMKYLRCPETVYFKWFSLFTWNLISSVKEYTWWARYVNISINMQYFHNKPVREYLQNEREHSLLKRWNMLSKSVLYFNAWINQKPQDDIMASKKKNHERIQFEFPKNMSFFIFTGAIEQESTSLHKGLITCLPTWLT